MIDLKKVIKGLECCLDDYGIDSNCSECPYAEKDVGMCMSLEGLLEDAFTLLKAQEPRAMTLEEVMALPYGHVLIETDKEGSLRWVDALLFCKNTNFSFDFITLEGRARLLGAEYNKEWRCWTSRPDEKVRAETAWEG